MGLAECSLLGIVFIIKDVAETYSSHSHIDAIKRLTLEILRIVLSIHLQLVDVVITSHPTIKEVEAKGC